MTPTNLTQRTFAILNWYNDARREHTVLSDIIPKLPASEPIVVFTKANSAVSASLNDIKDRPNISVAIIPEEIKTRPQLKNYAIKYFMTETRPHSRFLHVLEDSTVIVKDPTQFINDIEYMMPLVNRNYWFSTCTDPLNYVYAKYIPRLNIRLDSPDILVKPEFETLLMTAFANTQWVVYDLDNGTVDDFLFPEQYSIPVFYILDFLAAKRAKDTMSTGLNFINMYPTVPSEYRTFSRILAADDLPVDENLAKLDQETFVAKKLDTSPTNKIDDVLYILYTILSKKTV